MKIGIFDSGYGGLTILDKIRTRLPQYDYIYLGDNARSPYGSRSYDVVYKYTWECVKALFDMDCALVILACNTASAKALRSIQQNELLPLLPHRRLLGVIRPTVEVMNEFTVSNAVGVLATEGTIQSQSYPLEINKIFPKITVVGQSCPMLVPLIENNEYLSPGAAYFVQKYLSELFSKNAHIDAILLACTHYPIVYDLIKQYSPPHIKILTQGEIVADSLAVYLERHEDIEAVCSKNAYTEFYTTENVEKFQSSASIFLNENIKAKHIDIN